MSPFAAKIRHLITDYKRILKRHLSAKHYSTKIKTLQIKRTTMKNTNDVELYQIAHRILTDIELWLSHESFSASEFSGLDEFRNHITQSLKGYSLVNSKVINHNQQASRLIVECIQLLCLPLNDRVRKKLISNIELLKTLGSEEELEQLESALLKKNVEMNNQFLPILHIMH